MSIKITINNNEIKNPIARFLITLLGIVALLLVLIVVFFLFLPLMWFALLSIILVFAAVILSAPRLVRIYRVTLLDKRTDNINQK